ncbi:MAG: shikimate dehydrogenase [Deltaproteobacteria bacterium]|nr:shikimate dehydrogenase [Deltaproteobacteria bacterium]
MNITGKTKILGIFGYPITHTLSPIMHNTALKAKGIDMVYLPFEVSPDSIKTAVNAIRALNIHGVNITIPHKETVLSFLDEISEEAKLIGAVNTVVNCNGRLIGYNTDGDGYIASLKRDLNFNVKGKKVVLLGAGGAARAILAAAAKRGAKNVVIVNRTLQRAVSLADEFKRHFPNRDISASGMDREEFKRHLPDANLIINTTSLGMEGRGELDIPFDVVPKKQTIVSDIVYKPSQTSFLKKAGRYKIRTHRGLGMLVEQGAISFKLWTGQDMPKELVYKALKRRLNEKREASCLP